MVVGMNIADFVGGTPLIKLQNDDGSADIYVKIEHFNAGGSVKSRVAKQMIKDAMEAGILKTGKNQRGGTSGKHGYWFAMMVINFGF